MSDGVENITDGNFEEVISNSDIPILIDFWADWCGPCKMLAPVLDKVASELDGKVKIYKMNIDNSPDTPSKYGVRSIPTLLLFQDSKVIDQKVGVLTKDKLIEWIKSQV